MGNFKKLVLGTVIGGYVYGSYLAYKEVSKPEVLTYEDTKKWWKEKEVPEGEEDFTDTLEMEDISVHSMHGYNLYGRFIPNKIDGELADKTIILCHGFTANIYGVFKYIQLFYERGFNIVVYDHRNHGYSDKNFITYGYYEKDDLEAVVRFVKGKMGYDHKIATHGESMGAATVLQHAATYGGVEFVSADCPYGNMFEQLVFVLNRDGRAYQKPFLEGANLYLTLTGSGNLKKVSPRDMVKDMEVPMIITHGTADALIPIKSSKEIFDNKKKGIKKYVEIEGADHTQSIFVDREKYTREMYAFLDELGL
jgi:pimeloyl-ACP methyl ester carboxylesterase